MAPINLRDYDNSWYKPGRSTLWRAAWFFVGLPILKTSWLTSSSLRVHLLRLFGAKVGQRVTIKPAVNVKYPWHLRIGDDCWIGEGCWIDNLTTVGLGNNVCVSQGAYLCTGNHDWTDPAFGLILAPIRLNDGSWAGAKCLLGPGTVLGSGAIAGAGSVVSGIVPDFEIYAGNPAVFVKRRELRSSVTVQPSVQTDLREVR